MRARKTDEAKQLAMFERYQEHRMAGETEYDAKVLSRYENEPYPEKCHNCGAGPDEFEEGGGMVGETIVFCGKCHSILWEDTVGAIRAVL